MLLNLHLQTKSKDTVTHTRIQESSLHIVLISPYAQLYPKGFRPTVTVQPTARSPDPGGSVLVWRTWSSPKSCNLQRLNKTKNPLWQQDVANRGEMPKEG